MQPHRGDSGSATDPVWVPPPSLVVATWIVVAESLAGIAFVVTRDDLGPAAKVMLGSVFLAKVGFARMARSGVAAGVLAVMTFELVGIPIALGSDGPPAARLALAASVVVVFVLIGRSLRAFPSPPLPDLRSGPPR